jgi:hypothetical protein
MPAPTIEPTTIAVSEKSDSLLGDLSGIATLGVPCASTCRMHSNRKIALREPGRLEVLAVRD